MKAAILGDVFNFEPGEVFLIKQQAHQDYAVIHKHQGSTYRIHKRYLWKSTNWLILDDNILGISRPISEASSGQTAGETSRKCPGSASC